MRRISLMIVSLLMAVPSYSHEGAEVTRECVKLCRNSLNAADAHIEELNQVIKKQVILTSFYEKELAKSRLALMEELERREEWYKNPAFTVTVGIAVGLLTGVLVNER